MWLAELIGAILLWRWADKQDQQAADAESEFLLTLAQAPEAAKRWNAFAGEHHDSQVRRPRRMKRSGG
jgi:hypothetical protein